MRKIHVYTLPCILQNSFSSELPVDLDILGVEVYSGVPVLNGITNDDVTEKVKRVFRFYGAEEEITHINMTYIGSILLGNGKVALHLFEIPQPKGLGLFLAS